MTRDERSATLRAGCASSAPADARAFVARTGQSWDLPEPVIEAAQLATSELVSNSVEHALSGVQVTLALADDQLRIAVRDHSKSPPVRRIPNTSGARGRGIALVEAVADEWGVLPHPDGKTVWLVLPATGNGFVLTDGAARAASPTGVGGSVQADSTANAATQHRPAPPPRPAPRPGRHHRPGRQPRRSQHPGPGRQRQAKTDTAAQAVSPTKTDTTAPAESATRTDTPAKPETVTPTTPEAVTPAKPEATAPPTGAPATPQPAVVSAAAPATGGAESTAEPSVLERPEVVEVPEHAAE